MRSLDRVDREASVVLLYGGGKRWVPVSISTHHGRVLLRVRLPQVEHVALYHVRNVSPEPVAGQLLGIGVPLDAAQILGDKERLRFVPGRDSTEVTG